MQGSVEHQLRFLKFQFLQFCGAVLAVFALFIQFHV